MKQVFLTSSVHAVAHDIAKKVDLSRDNTLLFIDTPAEVEDGDKQWLRDDRQALVEAGFVVTDYTITGKTKEVLQKDLEPFPYIYVSGGNTFYFLEKSKETGFFSLIQDLVNNQGKTYIGTSAGSIIAGAKCPDYLLEESETVQTLDQTGFQFVNFCILPHWGSADFKDLYIGKRLEMAYKADQVPLLTLTDLQYVYVRNDQVQIVNLGLH